MQLYFYIVWCRPLVIPALGLGEGEVIYGPIKCSAVHILLKQIKLLEGESRGMRSSVICCSF